MDKTRGILLTILPFLAAIGQFIWNRKKIVQEYKENPKRWWKRIGIALGIAYAVILIVMILLLSVSDI